MMIITLIIVFVIFIIWQNYRREYIVIHYAPWCPACHRLMGKLPLFTQEYDSIPIYINNEDISPTSGITSYPTIIYNDRNNNKRTCNDLNTLQKYISE